MGSARQKGKGEGRKVTLEAILSAFEDALELERELGTRTVEMDRALLRPAPKVTPPPAEPPAAMAQQPSPQAMPAEQSMSAEQKSAADATRPDFSFLLECEPQGPVAELLPKMSEAIGYGPDGVKVNDPTARVLIVLGSAALQKWLPGVVARPGQWVRRDETPALVTASPTKTYRFYGHDAAKVHALKLRLWEDLKAALARLGKKPPARAGRREGRQ